MGQLHMRRAVGATAIAVGLLCGGLGFALGRSTAPTSTPIVVHRGAAADGASRSTVLTSGPADTSTEVVRARTVASLASRARAVTRESVPLEVVGEIREELLAEMRAEREVRHEQRREAFLSQRLDELADFAVANDLSDEAYGRLEDAVISLHERMDELGPPRGGPDAQAADREEGEAQRRAVFEAFTQEVDSALDESTAVAFHEWMRPPGPPGGGPL